MSIGGGTSSVFGGKQLPPATTTAEVKRPYLDCWSLGCTCRAKSIAREHFFGPTFEIMRCEQKRFLNG
jgi:hypothetical protein